MITFFGAGILRTDAVDSIVAAIKKYVATMNNEEGTMQYLVTQQQDEPRRILFFEQYKDEQAQKAHGEQPGFSAFMDQVMGAIDQMDFMGNFNVVAKK